MNRWIWCLVLLVWLVPLGGTSFGENGKINVSGQYKIALEPDYASLHLAIRHVEAKMDTAYSKMVSTLGRVVSRLGDLGVGEKDIIKSLVRQGPEYTWTKNKRILAGYFSFVSLGVKVRDLEQLHGIYGELSHHNTLEIRGTSYGREDLEKQRRRALEKALENARRKAVRMATALDMVLGSPLDIRALDASPRPVGTMALSRKSSGEIPSEPGGQFGMVWVDASVQAEFALLPGAKSP